MFTEFNEISKENYVKILSIVDSIFTTNSFYAGGLDISFNHLTKAIFKEIQIIKDNEIANSYTRVPIIYTINPEIIFENENFTNNLNLGLICTI